jgi:hypothetical protein
MSDPNHQLEADGRPGARTRVLELRHSELRRQVAGTPRLWDSTVVFVMPWTDRARAAACSRILAQRAAAPLLLLAVQDDTAAGPVAIWNDALSHSAGTWFGYVADDAFPGRGWLRIALDALARAPSASLLAFNDGKWYGQLAGFGLVRRQWLEGLYGGRLFHPDYRQHFGDTELTLIAREQRVLAYEPHAMLIEIDARKDGRAVNASDRAVFLRRQMRGFDGRVRDPELLRIFG